MTPLKRWELDLRTIGCVICRRMGYPGSPASLHHISEGSSVRSEWLKVPLCREHHQGANGLHGMSARTFIKVHRLPGESEYGLLAFAIEDVAKMRAGDLEL